MKMWNLTAPASTMAGAILEQPGRIRVGRVPIPQPGCGQVRVRLEGCGVCSSNLPPWEGREWFTYPMPPGKLGHEGWGVIDKLGPDVNGLKVGQRVAMLSDNAYAEFDVTPVEQIVPIPASLSGRPLPGEPLGCAMNIFERSGIEAGQTVAIVGIGFLGAMLTQLAAGSGAEVIAVSRRRSSLDIAWKMGADEIIQMDDHWKIIERVRELTNGRFCDVVIEAVGKQWPLDLASELTAERGRLVVAGYHQDGPRQINMQMWNWRGLDVINAHERDIHNYTKGIRRAIQAILAGRLDPWSLITHEYPLEQLDKALNDTRDRPEGFVKATIRLSDISPRRPAA